MANLIPPDAKKAIAVEYWIRVVSLWFYLVGFACLVVVLLKLPTLVLIESQLDSKQGEFVEAKAKQDAFKEAENTIKGANELAVLLAKFESELKPTDLIETIDEIAGEEVEISGLSLSAESDDEVVVQGLAATRQALASFTDNIESHPNFIEAELPISNLAKESDISFNITIILASEN